MTAGTNVINKMPYLRTTWDFPDEPTILAETLNRSYIEIAGMVNNRIIGIYPTNRPAVGGESWYLTSRKQQNLRQVYTFDRPAPIANIQHGIDTGSIFQFTKCTGSFTDGTNWYGCLYASNVAIAGQVSFYITQNSAPGVIDGEIVILTGAGAPVIDTGTIVLEWIVRTSSSN